MKSRCYNQSVASYPNYGGRGISICDEWQHFELFKKWSESHGYADGLTIDRIDNDGAYCPENCRWATRKEQSVNKRNNVLLTYKGKTQTISEWSKELGVERKTLSRRIDRGWSVEKTISVPIRKFTKRNYLNEK